VAEDNRQRHGDLAAKDRDVGVADAAGAHPDHDVMRAGRQRVDLLDREAVAVVYAKRSEHGYSVSFHFRGED
jgi:hypothetical protein